MTQDVNSKQELPKDEPSNNMNTSTNLLTVIEALQCQIQPQFITLQNAFLPQQMPTNTTEDVQLVQTTTASEAGIHINPFLPSTQIPQQLLNCQEGPQQFVQSGHDTQNANGLFEVVQPMRTMTEEGQESLFEYLPNIEETGVFLDGTQPIQINGQQIFLTANGQIIEASNNVIQTNFLQEIGQPPQIPTASVNTLTITPKVSFPTESSDITPTNTNAEVIYLTTNNNSKEDIEQEEQVSDQNQSQIQCQIIPIASLPIPTSEVGTTQETNVQQTVPVQLPISLENGETVYLTVQLPPSSLTEKILGVIQPEIQAIPQYAQQQMGGSLNLVLGNEVQDHTIPDAPQLSESNDFLLQQQEHQQMHQRQSDVNESSKYARKIHCTCPNCTNFIGDSNQKRKHICHLEGCNKHYDKPYQLKAHLKWHTGEKPHKCDFSPGVCFKRFKRADQLQRHLRTHSREKRFECPQCLRMFSRSDHLANHIDVHIRKNKKIWGVDELCTC